METLVIVLLLAALLTSAWMDTVFVAIAAIVVYLAFGFLVIGLPEVTLMTVAATSAVSLGIGALWSLWKWRRWVNGPIVQKALRESKDKYDTAVSNPKDYARPTKPFRESDYFPEQARAAKNIDRIISWITLWMFSMIVYFFEDFLMDIGRWIYNRLAKIYENITTSALPDDMK